MSTHQQSHNFNFSPPNNQRLALLCGQCDENLRWIEKQIGVSIYNRGHSFQIHGQPHSVALAGTLLQKLYAQTADHNVITPLNIHLTLQEVTTHNSEEPKTIPAILTKYKKILPKSPNQAIYLKNIATYDLSFGIGPAGSGKTYLAVAAAIEALEKDRVSRIILVRPAIEAGERLGFLPGDLAQKVDPYLRPLYDAMYEMLGLEKVVTLIEKNAIEIAPLAYMRGRTLNEAFIILDEAQNTTKEQMKMFLTRLGFGSTAVVNGDLTQIDLPKGTESGLRHGCAVLKGIPGISFTYFESNDVVRSPLVKKIVEAYDKAEHRK